MKIKIVLFIILFLRSLSFLSADTIGYLSFEYSRGQKESGAYQGLFGKSELGFFSSGLILPKMSYGGEISFNQTQNFQIEQAWIGYNAAQVFNLKVGVFPVPFGHYNYINRPLSMPLINTPLQTELFLPYRWKEMGVLAEGDISGLIYSFYFGNGLSEKETLNSPQDFRENNQMKGRGGKIGFSLDEKTDIFYSRYWGKYDDSGERNLKLEALNGRISLLGIDFVFEGIRGTLENPLDLKAGKVEGYSVHMSFELDRFLPYVCYQKAKYDDSFHGTGFVSGIMAGQGILLNKNRWAAGLTYFFSPKMLIKLEYDWNKDIENDLDDNILIIQAALTF